MHYDILIRDCTLLDSEMEIQTHRTIAIRDGVIAVLGNGDVVGTANEIIDGKNKLFMPGLLDGHSHICQQFLRGHILDELPMIWTRIMLPFESTLTEEVVEAEAQLACLEMIKSGTVGFADAGGRYMHRVAQTVLDSGLRAALTCSTIDLGNAPATMKSSAEENIKRNTELFEQYHGKGDGRLSVFFSVRSMLSCSDALTRQVFETAQRLGTGVHAHMSEYPGEVNACLEQHQMRPMEYLDSMGLLGSHFLAAHGILLSENEIDIAAQRGVQVVHCPFSNSGKGVPPTPQLLRRGVTVGMGTDGAAHGGLSLWNEMKIFRCVMNAHTGVPSANPLIMPAKTLLAMATSGSASAMGLEKSGALREGWLADMISIDLTQPHIMPSGNLTNTLLETVNAGDVQDMIVGGKLIMRDRTVLTMDESAVVAKAKALQEQLFEKRALEGVA